MDPELKIHINELGKFRTEYITSAIQNLSKLDSFKDYIFNNINKNILSRVEKLQNLKSRINRIRAILPILNECNNALTIKSKIYYPISKHNYYHYINLEDRQEEINRLINSIYNWNNQNNPTLNIKKPLVEKKESNVLGKIENFDECISAQSLSNMQKKVKDLASELYETRFKNIGSSLVNESKDLVYEKTPYLQTSFDFMNKKLIQKADLLWKVNKEEIDLTQEKLPKSSTTKPPPKPQQPPKSIKAKTRIEKVDSKRVLFEKPKEKKEFNLPESIINLKGVSVIPDEIQNEEAPVDENIYPEREEYLDLDFDEKDINNPNDEDDLPVNIIIRRNEEKNKRNINKIVTTPNYKYKTANTSNINNTSNTININLNTNANINSITNQNVNANINSITNQNVNANINNKVHQAPPQTSNEIGKIVVISGGGPGVPLPPPPPPPPPAVVIKPVEKVPKIKGEDKPRELSMAEQLAKIKLKKVPTVSSNDIPKEEPKKKPLNPYELLKMQIKQRREYLKMHEEKDEDEEEENED